MAHFVGCTSLSVSKVVGFVSCSLSSLSQKQSSSLLFLFQTRMLLNFKEVSEEGCHPGKMETFPDCPAGGGKQTRCLSKVVTEVSESSA